MQVTEATQARVTEQNGCHPLLPILTWDRNATSLRLDIVGHVQVWGNTGAKQERNGCREVLATCWSQCAMSCLWVTSWHSLVQLQGSPTPVGQFASGDTWAHTRAAGNIATGAIPRAPPSPVVLRKPPYRQHRITFLLLSFKVLNPACTRILFTCLSVHRVYTYRCQRR